MNCVFFFSFFFPFFLLFFLFFFCCEAPQRACLFPFLTFFPRYPLSIEIKTRCGPRDSNLCV